MITLDQVKEMKPEEVIRLKYTELSDEAFEFVHEAHEINFCDACDCLESTHDLIWITEDFRPRENEHASDDFLNAYWDCALCEECYLEEIQSS